MAIVFNITIAQVANIQLLYYCQVAVPFARNGIFLNSLYCSGRTAATFTYYKLLFPRDTNPIAQTGGQRDNNIGI